MSASEETSGVDARLLLPAAVGWLTAFFLVAQRPLIGVLTGVSGSAALLVLLVRWRLVRVGGSDRVRRLLVTGFGLVAVVTAMAFASALHVQTLRSGPVTALAATEAAVTVRLTIDSDPSLRTSPGSRQPPYVVVRGTVEEVTGRGRTTRVRTPVLVIGSQQWQQVRFGQLVEAKGRLGPVDAGSDVAAVLSARAAPRALDQPAWWLRAAERVRAGLRDSVQSEPEEVRGLVPALVMGDESGLPGELAEDFKVTGLTHLSAVSGTNVESRDGCPLSTAALARRPLCWRPAAYRSGAAARAQLDSERSASKGSMWRLCSPEPDQWFLALGSSRRADEFAPSIGPGKYPDRSRSPLWCPWHTLKRSGAYIVETWQSDAQAPKASSVPGVLAAIGICPAAAISDGPETAIFVTERD